MRKLSALLAILLCAVLTFALPVVTNPAPSKVAKQTLSVADDASFVLTAGEVSSGDTKGVLQLDNVLLSRLFRTLLQQVYPQSAISPAVPAFYAFSRTDHLHTILTKGP
ncbi:hypothetical protein GCM10023188_18720 [Pontibacter saemangeumensis]|uniref:Uncharacterized protein n=1 Tax=Pontibacter saemangeumensis TaxID=1084525 RepID=A0ABP8LMN9_9BACT